MEAYMMYIWLGVIVLSVALEAATSQLISIWFVAGALVGVIANALGANMGLQILLAVVVTLVFILFTRPLLQKKLSSKPVGTNSDRFVGEEGVVIERIDNAEAKGQVKVGASIWTARSKNHDIIPVDTAIKVLEIEGVKLIVEPVSQADSQPCKTE